MENFELKSAINFVGNYYNGIYVTKFSHFSIQPSGKKKAMFSCVCHCGEVFTSLKDNIIKGKTKSCGCNRVESSKKNNLDLLLDRYIGKTFGNLTVNSLHSRKKVSPKRTKILWNCVCDCGKEVVRSHKVILYNTEASCGCVSKSMNYHGHSYSKTYKIWTGIIQRCTNERDKNYHQYGDRGIEVCSRWLESFENFLEDMGECPDGLSIDRINVNGNYEPSNCRWTTSSVQGFNKRSPKNTIGVTGVNMVKGKYKVFIGRNYLGSFTSLEEAVKVRKEAEIRVYGFNLTEENVL